MLYCIGATVYLDVYKPDLLERNEAFVMIHKHCNISPPTQTFPNTNDCYSMKNQMSLKWSVWSHTWDRVATPNPVLHPAKTSSGLLNHYPIIHVRAESSAANNARQTKGRRCVYLCPAHVWEVQMQLFIYNPPNVPVVHSW